MKIRQLIILVVDLAIKNEIDIFCNINEAFPSGNYSIKFNNNKFKYSNYTFHINEFQ